MRFDLDRLPTDPVLLHQMLREMAEAIEPERGQLKTVKETVKAQKLKIEKLEHGLARLLGVQFGRSSERMEVAQLRLMFDEVQAPSRPMMMNHRPQATAQDWISCANLCPHRA